MSEPACRGCLALGRLFQVSGSAGATEFLYDGDELLSEFGASGAILRRYVHGPGSDDPLFWYEGSEDGDRRSLVADHQGSILASVNGAGTAVTTNSYDPWGLPAAGNAGRFGYTGQAWILELGLWHYKARFYSPTLGRFLQVDPIGYDDQVNLYAYVGNDPINAIDPGGLITSCTGSNVGCKEGGLAPSQAGTSSFSTVNTPGERAPHGPRAYGSGGQSGRIDSQEVASNEADLARVRLRENRLAGRTGEEVALQSLQRGGFTVIGRQVYVRDSYGNLRIVDFVVRTGAKALLGVEVKYGAATRSTRQQAIDNNIRDYGGRVTSRGLVALPYGQAVQFKTIEIHVNLRPSP